MIHFAPGVLAEFAASVQRVFGGEVVNVRFDERECNLSVTVVHRDDAFKIPIISAVCRQFDFSETVTAGSTINSIRFVSSIDPPLVIEYGE